MDKMQMSKRNASFVLCFGLMLLLLTLVLVIPFLPPFLHPPKLIYLLLAFASGVVPLIFWYEAFYHWSKAKGYHGSLALLGTLGFPLALLPMAMLKDRLSTEVIHDRDSSDCPRCGAKYYLSDYDPRAEHIFCSACKAELPRTKDNRKSNQASEAIGGSRPSQPHG